jgi:predicted HNH restriction endonuclease
VHHRKPLEQCTDDEKTDQDLLMACCAPCHGAIEAEKRAT